MNDGHKREPAARLQRWLNRRQPSGLAKLAASGVGFYASRRRRIRRPVPSDALTIVVGSLSVGGAGKTPVAMDVALTFQSYGRVAVVCRGWGGTDTHPRRVTACAPELDGDEAAMLRDKLPDSVEVWAARDLARGRECAAASADIIIVDDGFQTQTLPRHFDVVVVDATSPMRVVPAGPLREPIDALDEADVIWLHKVDEPGAQLLPSRWPPHITSVYEGVRVYLQDGQSIPATALDGRLVRPWSGIGRPESLIHTLEKLGARVEPGRLAGDHTSPSGGIEMSGTELWVAT